MYKPAFLLYGCLICAMAAAASLDDPTRPSRATVPVAADAAPASRPPRWILQSTLVARARRVAVINGAVVREGDRIEGARVVRVLPGRVQLEQGGRHFELRLPEAAVKLRRTTP